MIWTKEQLAELDGRYRGRFINSISGVKPANLIATKSKDGLSNVALFSSVVHLGANPAMLGFVMRPPTVERHTWDNILETEVYTINMVTTELSEKAHYSSARSERSDSEFELCDLEEAYYQDFHAPYVGNSPLSYGMRLENKFPISNGCYFISGTVEWVKFDEAFLAQDGYLDIAEQGAAGIVALDGYHGLSKQFRLSFAKKGEQLQQLKDFKKGW